jgi:hypothetical protein
MQTQVASCKALVDLTPWYGGTARARRDLDGGFRREDRGADHYVADERESAASL